MVTYCDDYENRPQICRDFSCGKVPCENCGGCCHDVCMSMPPGMETLVENDSFFRRHGIVIEQGQLLIKCRCVNLVDGVYLPNDVGGTKKAHAGRRSITYNKVPYDINTEVGLADPECWECTSHKGRLSNGILGMNRDGFRNMPAWIFWSEYGETPDVVQHFCGNKSCINPTHLVGMTVEEAKKAALPAAPGRPPKSYGSMYRASVSPEKLAEIRKMLAEDYTPVEIGRKLGVSYLTIRGIAAGALYKHE